MQLIQEVNTNAGIIIGVVKVDIKKHKYCVRIQKWNGLCLVQCMKSQKRVLVYIENRKNIDKIERHITLL